MNPRKPVVFAYDITKNKTRRRVLRILKAWRLDGQKSVHECRLKESQAEELFIEINERLNPKTDLLLMAWLEPHRQVQYRGVGKSSVTRKIWYMG